MKSTKKEFFSVDTSKMKVLEPAFKKQITNLFQTMEQSISILYDLATKDEKTGLYNHRFFKTMAEMEMEKARRGTPLSLLILDIDFFKKVNDTYGHLMGDKILEELAKLTMKKVRVYDIVARFGGEEFFILLPNTKEKKAILVAERLRKSLPENKILKKYNITVSIGITQYEKGDNLAKMTKRADDALYISKKEGRNRSTLK